jgi:NAD(P)H-flavin reductase
MLSKKYRSKLINIQNHLDGVFTLEFVSLSSKFRYNPGQFLHIALDTEYDGTGQWPDSRCFSMQSNPNEDTIRITYSIKGKFTRQMEEFLKPGSEVWLKLPYGELFTQPHNKENTVFIAGGTGITPFLSLFTHSSFKDYINPSIYLGFRSKSFNFYENELNFAKNCNLNFFYEDIDGPLNINNIFSVEGKESDYFISGPPAMIKSFKDILIVSGLSSGHILTDDWE